MSSGAARFRAFSLALLLASLADVGCSSTSTCSRDKDDSTVTAAQGLRIDNAWYSAPPITGPYQHFPAARTVHFHHGLGKTPVFQVYLAFADHGQFAAAEGNEAIITRLDDQEVDVHNDTCAEFYIDFVASLAALPPSADGAAGAAN